MEKKREGAGRERGKERAGEERVSARSTHCLMLGSSATNSESRSCTDSTPTLFDVEPRKQSGTVT